jgi:hypothetical protein
MLRDMQRGFQVVQREGGRQKVIDRLQGQGIEAGLPQMKVLGFWTCFISFS